MLYATIVPSDEALLASAVPLAINLRRCSRNDGAVARRTPKRGASLHGRKLFPDQQLTTIFLVGEEDWAHRMHLTKSATRHFLGAFDVRNFDLYWTGNQRVFDQRCDATAA